MNVINHVVGMEKTKNTFFEGILDPDFKKSEKKFFSSWKSFHLSEMRSSTRAQEFVKQNKKDRQEHENLMRELTNNKPQVIFQMDFYSLLSNGKNKDEKSGKTFSLFTFHFHSI